MEDVLIALEEELRSKTLTDVTFLATNFRGVRGQYNPSGRRNFLVLVPVQQAKDLLDASWPVKQRLNNKGVPFECIKVSFPDDFDISKIKLNGKTLASDKELAALDRQEIFIGTLDLYGMPWYLCPEHGRPERWGIHPYIVGMDLRTKA